MGKQLQLVTTAVKAKPQRQKSLPGNEGKTWERCRVCGRPVFDPISRARKVGPTCFKRKKGARKQANQARQQVELAAQLILFADAEAARNSLGGEETGIDETLGF